MPEREPPPGPSTVDLHVHTARSDGILEPDAIAAAAWDVGVRVLAIADHDTLAGYREVIANGVPRGMTLVPAVEINAVTHGLEDIPDGELHILGYGVDPDDEAFEAALAAQRDARRRRFDRTVDRLRELGTPIDAQVEGLEPGAEDALGRPTIARALMAAGFATSVEDAFARLIGRGGPAYLPREGLGPIEAIGAIRAAGGLAALAHFREAATHRTVVAGLVTAGLGGIEVHYRAFRPDEVRSVGVVADEFGLVPTGGSDYHGDTGSYADHHAGLWVPPEVAERLLARIQLRMSR